MIFADVKAAGWSCIARFGRLQGSTTVFEQVAANVGTVGLADQVHGHGLTGLTGLGELVQALPKRPGGVDVVAAPVIGKRKDGRRRIRRVQITVQVPVLLQHAQNRTVDDLLEGPQAHVEKNVTGHHVLRRPVHGIRQGADQAIAVVMGSHNAFALTPNHLAGSAIPQLTARDAGHQNHGHLGGLASQRLQGRCGHTGTGTAAHPQGGDEH